MVSLLASQRRDAPAVATADVRPAQAFVLSGGGSAGAAQVGMLRALLEAGTKPDLVVGCSVGALNAAFLAVDPTLSRIDELEQMWLGLDRGNVFGAGRRQPLTNLLRRECYLYEPAGLHRVIRQAVPLRDLSETAIPCHVVTTDLTSGSARYWTSGDPVAVLGASACLPGIFPPVLIDGSLQVDGGVACPVPVSRAVGLSARMTWTLDVSGGSIGRRDERMTALDVLLLSFSISRSLLNQGEDVVGADQRVVRLPRIELGRHDMRDFSRTAELIAMGYDSTRAHLAALDATSVDLSAVEVPRASGWRRLPRPRRAT
jgi:NTE family protein